MAPCSGCMQVPVAVVNPHSHHEQCWHILRHQALKALQLLQCIRPTTWVHLCGPVDGTIGGPFLHIRTH